MKKNNRKKIKFNFREKLYEIIFEADTKAGFIFDIVLIIFIVLSVIISMLDSIKSINEKYSYYLNIIEYFFTIIFTIEYILRIICSKKPVKYIFSFWGTVDLVSILPTYLALFFSSSASFLFIRVLRLLRIIRVLKLSKYGKQAKIIKTAIIKSIPKISVFFFTVFILVILIGALMYLVEGPENGFTSIPDSIYWAVVTITTVGYGDISPKTPIGRAISVLVMLIGYSLLAVPTGIAGYEISKIKENISELTQVCPDCHKEGHDIDAIYCKYCGKKLNNE